MFLNFSDSNYFRRNKIVMKLQASGKKSFQICQLGCFHMKRLLQKCASKSILLSTVLNCTEYTIHKIFHLLFGKHLLLNKRLVSF